MKKIVLSVFIAWCVIPALAQKEIVNDPNAEPRTVTGSYTSIKISGGIDLFLSQAENEAVAVSASEAKYKNAIKTEVTNGVLRIYYDADRNWTNWKIKNLRVYVAFKNLENLTASGACDVQVSGIISVPDLKINLSGACDFTGAVKLNSLHIDLSGASDVKISGTASTVTIESSGASDVKGYDLTTDFCTANASGSSDINITVNKELNAHASGSSDIIYKGTAVIKELHASGSSNIVKKS
jgi:hypothetical protein